jgi:hypothetical protein
MNLAELKSKGACVDLAPVRRSVSWTHKDESGEEITDIFDVWVRRLSFGAIDRLSKTDEAERSRNAELIAACIRLGEHAEEAMPYDVAYSLHTSLAIELVRAIGEVNRLNEAEVGDSPKD